MLLPHPFPTVHARTVNSASWPGAIKLIGLPCSWEVLAKPW